MHLAFAPGKQNKEACKGTMYAELDAFLSIVSHIVKWNKACGISSSRWNVLCARRKGADYQKEEDPYSSHFSNAIKTSFTIVDITRSYRSQPRNACAFCLLMTLANLVFNAILSTLLATVDRHTLALLKRMVPNNYRSPLCTRSYRDQP